MFFRNERSLMYLRKNQDIEIQTSPSWRVVKTFQSEVSIIRSWRQKIEGVSENGKNWVREIQ